jgi:thermitase
VKKLAGLAAAAVVVTMTGVTTWAMADVAEPAPVRVVVGLRTGADAAGPMRAVAGFAGVRWAKRSDAADRQLDALEARSAVLPGTRSRAALRADPNVEYVEVEQRVRALDLTPDDPLYATGQTELAEVTVPAAWDTTTGSAVTVAVLDTGVTATGDLAGAVLPGYDYVNRDSNPADDEGHGTSVASLIAARGNNGAGMAGVCWSCKILPVKVLDHEGYGYPSDIAQGMVWAVRNGAKIINVSLGSTAWSQVMADAVAYANLKGVLVVAAAGNSGSSTKNYPAAYAGVVSVGATAPGSDAPSSWSNRNSATNVWVDVAAPGTVTAMDHRGRYGTVEGTSFSAPIVAGVAALVKTRNPSYTGYSLHNAVIGKARPIGSWVSAGKVDAARSLTATTDRIAPTVTGTSPAQNAKVRGTVTIRPSGVADAGGAGVRNVDLYAYGRYVSQDTAAPYEPKIDTTKQKNGPVALTIYVYDRAGNRASYARTIIADNLAPSVSITSAPRDRARITGTVTIKVAASDYYGINRTELLVNGKVVATDRTAAYQFSIRASSQPRTMKVQVRAYDSAGNVKYTPARTWTR